MLKRLLSCFLFVTLDIGHCHMALLYRICRHCAPCLFPCPRSFHSNMTAYTAHFSLREQHRFRLVSRFDLVSVSSHYGFLGFGLKVSQGVLPAETTRGPINRISLVNSHIFYLLSHSKSPIAKYEKKKRYAHCATKATRSLGDVPW